MKRFIMLNGVMAICLSLLGTPILARAQSAAPIDKKAVESIIHDYLMNNPDVLHKALQNAAAHAEAIEAKEQEAAVTTSRNDLFSNSRDPVTGNQKAKVNLAYFFDYQCGYCKKMIDAHSQLFTNDGPARVVLKELPILGPASTIAARAALAAGKQGKYMPFHDLLMDMRGPLSEARIMTLASTIGLDQDQLKKDMADPAIDQHLAQNRALAQRLGINGTPGYVVEDTLIPGALSTEDLRKVINDAAAKKK